MNERVIKKTGSILESLEYKFPKAGTKLLISCCNKNGGLFLFEILQEGYNYVKIFDGDTRGIVPYKDNSYLLLTGIYGPIILDSNFNIISMLEFVPLTNDGRYIDFHGVAIYNDLAYIVETADNTIGIYELPSLNRIDEIVLAPKGEDTIHMNDIYICNDIVYVSMFSKEESWRNTDKTKGIILKFPINDQNDQKIIFSDLLMPHSISSIDDKIYFCNSSEFSVYCENYKIIKKNGYLRGLSKIENTIWVGQSTSRNVELIRNKGDSIDLTCGLYAVDMKEKVNVFFPLPAEEVYGIIDCTEKLNNIDIDFQTISMEKCQCFFNNINTFCEDNSVIKIFSKSFNKKRYINITFDIPKETNYIRFDPAIEACEIYDFTTQIQQNGAWVNIQPVNNNSSDQKDNNYFFQDIDPQFYFNVVDLNISKIRFSYSINFTLNQRELFDDIERIMDPNFKKILLKYKDIIVENENKVLELEDNLIRLQKSNNNIELEIQEKECRIKDIELEMQVQLENIKNYKDIISDILASNRWKIGNKIGDFTSIFKNKNDKCCLEKRMNDAIK